jgi:aminopeptidase N
VLALASALPADASPIVWQRVVGVLNDLDRHYGTAPTREAFRAFARGLLAPVAARLGSDPVAEESSNLTVLRTELMQAQALFGDAEVVERARQSFATDSGTAAQKRMALSIVAARADEAMFAALLQRAQKTADPLEKQHLFMALGAVDDPGLARRMAEISMTDQLPPGTGLTVLRILATRHADLVWKTIEPHLDELPFDKPDVRTLAVAVVSDSADPRRIPELKAYEARSVPVEARKPFLAADAAVRQNQLFATKVLPGINDWIVLHRGLTGTN